MAKPKGRFLFTWNEKKHPEVVEFFDQIEEGFYSHYIREAIAFYVKHNLKSETPPATSNVEVQEGSTIKKNVVKENENSQQQESNSDYDGFFNPDMLS